MEKLEDAEVVAFVGEAKFAAQAFEFDVADDQVGLARGAVGDDRALHIGNDSLHVGLIKAQNRSTVKGHAIDELHEGILNIFERGVLVQMLAVDGSNDGNHGHEQQEAAVTLVSFDHEKFALAQPSGRSSLIDAAADDKGRIEMGGRKNRPDDRSRGGLAVSAGYRNTVFQAHPLGQHFPAPDDRDLALVRYDDFGTVRGLDP